MKIFNIITHQLAKLYWKIIKPNTLGVRLLLINNKKILLVKHIYQKSYFLPGGGLKHNENFNTALERELKEELNLKINNTHLFGIYKNNLEGKKDTIVVFHSTDKVNIDNLIFNDGEIEKAVLVDINNLPANTSAGSKRRIEEYKLKKNPTTGAW